VAARQAQDAVVEKVPSLVNKAPAADWQRVEVEEQCELLINELALLHLRGSKLS
jgi:hypothetical protein